VLAGVSTRYSQQMVSERFFDHTTPDGTTFGRPLSAAGYDVPTVGAQARTSVGVRARAAYRDIGIGIAMGTPVDQSWGATYTTDFGAGASGHRATTRAATRRHRRTHTR
jgi:hypothetical protein